MEDRGRKSWMRVLDGDERELFKEIADKAESIVKSTRSSLTLKHIQEFRDTFFEDGEWNEEDDRVFGSALEILSSMGDEEIPGLFRLFLSLIDETAYVERSDDEKGIRVYAYPASAGLITPVHYIIGLDDRTTRMKIDDYSLHRLPHTSRGSRHIICGARDVPLALIQREVCLIGNDRRLRRGEAASSGLSRFLDKTHG